MLKPYHHKGVLEAGCDEAGRGCIAGPVYAAAVILPQDFNNPLLNDSKKLNFRIREELRAVIERDSLAWGVGTADEKEIDSLNILNASLLAMHRAIDRMKLDPEFLLVDGNKFKPYAGVPHRCVVKGDGIFASIAAASILAKTHRDQYMSRLHHLYPAYGWNQNKGYPTRSHRIAIRESGPTEYHRRSFRLLDEQLFTDRTFNP